MAAPVVELAEIAQPANFRINAGFPNGFPGLWDPALGIGTWYVRLIVTDALGTFFDALDPTKIRQLSKLSNEITLTITAASTAPARTTCSP